MYRVILIDDEPIILQGLHQIIDWKAMGFDIIGSASNGKEGLELALLVEPDLIVTDIRMKFMDGITLIKMVKEKNKDIVTVVISAYDEFSYAQDACNLGAFSYILKPIVKEDFKQVISKVKRFLDQRTGGISEAGHEELPMGDRSYLNENTYSKLINDAILFINEKATNPELSVHMVGEIFQVNPIYFGQLFKKETGNSFHEHINHVRIEKAKSLLNHSHTKVYEIAERIGFKNAYYFNVVFKKLTGLTPLEYRNKDGLKGDDHP